MSEIKLLSHQEAARQFLTQAPNLQQISKSQCALPAGTGKVFSVNLEELERQVAGDRVLRSGFDFGLSPASFAKVFGADFGKPSKEQK